MALWHGYLLLGLCAVMAGWLTNNRVCQWVAGLWCLGIILMQAPIEEPYRWLYAIALWTVLALFTGLHVRAALPAFFIALIPLGYAALLLNSGLPIGAVGVTIAFTVTELPGVIAIVVGGWGVPNGIRNLCTDYIKRCGTDSVGKRNTLFVAKGATQAPAEKAKKK